MRSWQARCETASTDSLIVLRERKSKVVFTNPNGKPVLKIQVDGCAINEGKRCDWLLIGADDKEHFVELKSSHVEDAVEQLKKTIVQLSKAPKTHPKCTYVISARVPLATPKIQILAVLFKRDYGSALHVKRSGSEFPV